MTARVREQEDEARAADDEALEATRTDEPAASVRLAGEPLTPADIARLADGARLELAPEAVRRIEASRAVVDRFVEGDEPIYGLNTGLGHLRNERVPLQALREYQSAIVAMHAGGIGEALPARIVRAAMAVRVAGIARGGSGASLAVAETLVAMLNADVHPVVPRLGSVGAADLMHMAAIGLVMTGGGSAELEGEVLPGDEALRRAGMEPPSLQPKDGLAIVSANGVSVGQAALVAVRAQELARLADVALAASLEAARGNLSIIDPAVALAKPLAGQAAAAQHLRALLSGSSRCLAGAGGSVQDPLSFRVGPQVHGALRDSLSHFEAQVRAQLAAMDDNPLVDVEGGRLISNGNFHPLGMALAADALRPALAHVGQLSDRRLNHLWSTLLGSVDPTDMEALASAPDFGGLLMRYAGAARYTELRALAEPATLDVAPLDLAVEDHATNAPIAVGRTDEALDVLVDLLAVELLTAADVLRAAAVEMSELGAGTRAAMAELGRLRAELGERPSTQLLHRGVVAALFDRLLPAAEEAAGL